jgi:hypothetical protein
MQAKFQSVPNSWYNRLGLRFRNNFKQYSLPHTPLDVFGDLYQGWRHGFKNFNIGVWFGHKPLDFLGGVIEVRSRMMDYINKEIAHAVVRVDGRTFSLSADTINGPIVIKVLNNTENNRYSWTYEGRNKHNQHEIDKIIREFNDMKIIYSLIKMNCQHFSHAFRDYALGKIDEASFFKRFK